MKIRFLTKLFCAAAFLSAFLTPVFAQSEIKTSPKKTNPAPAKKQKSLQKTADPASNNSEPSELGEAIRYLHEIENKLISLKVYTLADTEKRSVAPQIIDSAITTGKKADRFQRISDKVFGFHQLEDVCSGILFEDEKPSVFTYRLRSVSFSTGIFDILSDDETSALIAHEVGHIYLGKELMNAREANDEKAARIIELKCDAIALITLRNLKINPAVLTKAIKKLIKAREKLELPIAAEQSVPLDDRIKLTKYFLKNFKVS